MSTIEKVQYSTAYPLLFAITDGPSFSRIADASKYFHDPSGDIPLLFTGTLTDIRTSKTRKVKIVGDAYGFWAGTNYDDGEMMIFGTFRRYITRFGPSWHYNWRNRNRDGMPPLELMRWDAPKQSRVTK